MTSSLFGRAVGAVLIAASLILVSMTGARAGAKDTPDDVMRAGQQAGPGLSKLLGELTQRASSADAKARAEIDSQISGLRKLQALITRLGRDRAFATQTVDLSQKGNKSGLAALWQKEVPGSRFEIREIKDFWAFGFASIDGWLYEVCLGEGCKAVFRPLGRDKK